MMLREDLLHAFLFKQMIEAAFKVDRLRFLPRSEVAKLLSYKVNADVWNEGADILRQAQTTERGKRYLTIEERDSTQRDFRPIRLDIHTCEWWGVDRWCDCLPDDDEDEESRRNRLEYEEEMVEEEEEDERWLRKH